MPDLRSDLRATWVPDLGWPDLGWPDLRWLDLSGGPEVAGRAGRERGMTGQKIIIDCDPGHRRRPRPGVRGRPPRARAARDHHRGRQRRPGPDDRERAAGAGLPGPARTFPWWRAARARWCGRRCTRAGYTATSGLGAARLPESASRPADGHAVDYLAGRGARRARSDHAGRDRPADQHRARATAVPGPGVAGRADFVIMGGSAGRGNVTPAAEFNIAADPEAAAIVFGAGLDRDHGRPGRDAAGAGHRGDPGPDARPRAAGRRPAAALPGRLPATRAGPLGCRPRTARPCTTSARWRCVAAPGLFTCLPARVEVETAGRWTAGMTVTDFDAPARDPQRAGGRRHRRRRLLGPGPGRLRPGRGPARARPGDEPGWREERG